MSTTIEQVDEQIDHLDFDVCNVEKEHPCQVTVVALGDGCVGPRKVCQPVADYISHCIEHHPDNPCDDCGRKIKNCWSITPL